MTKVLLLKAVPKLGKKDEIVDVSLGFANNALFPKKLAVMATDEVIAALKRRQQNVVVGKAIQHDLLDRAIQSVAGKTLVLKVKSSDTGSLFSKVDAATIAEFLLKEHRITIDASHIHISNGTIKKTGQYPILIHDGEYQATLTIEIKSA